MRRLKPELKPWKLQENIGIPKSFIRETNLFIMDASEGWEARLETLTR